MTRNEFLFKVSKIEHTFLKEYERVKFNQIELIFTKFDTIPIYNLKVYEKKDRYYSNSLRYDTYVIKSIEEKFEREDCGDFDG